MTDQQQQHIKKNWEHTHIHRASQVASSKEVVYNAGDAEATGLIPVSERCPGGGNGNPLQYSCLENSMDRGAWKATVQGVAKSQTQLSD